MKILIKKEYFYAIVYSFFGYNNVIYEICNEPNGNTSWKEMKSYAQEVIPIIRANDSDAVILVGTSNWSQYGHTIWWEQAPGIMYTLVERIFR